jgi:hypothetical protein
MKNNIKINSKRDQDYYYIPLEEPITNLNIASAMHALGHKIVRFEKEINSKNCEITVFYFQKNDLLDRDINLFLNNELMGPFLSLFKSKDHLKNIINNIY